MKVLARIDRKNNRKQLLQDHLLNVAELCSEFLETYDYGNLGYFLGLTHDIGKYSPAFQKPLKENSRSSIKHALLSGEAIEKFLSEYDQDIVLLNRFLKYFIPSHHTRIDEQKLKQKQNTYTDGEIEKILSRFINDIEDLDINLSKVIARANEEMHQIGKIFNDPPSSYLLRPLIVRFIYSALIDADRTDAYNFMQQDRYQSKTLKNELFDSYQQSQSELMQSAPNTPLNRKRAELYKKVISRNFEENQIFTLTAPTGIGKTRTALGFGLKHAMNMDHDRVITVIPYRNIIVQTADVYREILGGENVLEHHSSVSFEEDYKAFASFNWNIPKVVTTGVRFFETLFSNRPSNLRRFHNLTNSTVIVDESQSIPEKYLKPILIVIEELVENFNTSFLFMTATQPPWENLNITGRDFVDITPDSELSLPDRVNYRVEKDVSEKEEIKDYLTARQSSEESTLFVTNTRKDCLKYYKMFRDIFGNDAPVYHLSTSMTSSHRREIIKEVRKKLENDKVCHLISTQIVEAGVDLDFDRGYRLIGPLPNIIQAAGRVNREFEHNSAEFTVLLPEDSPSPPGLYNYKKQITEDRIDDFFKDGEIKNMEKYYRYLFRAEKDLKDICEKEKKMQFREVNKKFKMIDKDSFTFLIAESLPEEYRYIQGKIRDEDAFLTSEELKVVYSHSLELYDTDVEKLGLAADEDSMQIYDGEYDGETGIAPFVFEEI